MPNSKHGNILGGATANASIPGAHANDVEASTNSNHIKVNLDDDRWIIDVNIDNIITKIVQHQTFADQLGSWWRKRLLGRNNPPNNFVGDPLEVYTRRSLLSLSICHVLINDRVIASTLQYCNEYISPNFESSSSAMPLTCGSKPANPQVGLTIFSSTVNQPHPPPYLVAQWSGLTSENSPSPKRL